MARSRKTAAVAAADHEIDRPGQDREAWIATAAYYLAESRGFPPGSEVEDWLEAERMYLDQMETN